MIHPLIRLLQEYERLCNVYAVEDILDLFSDDGCIVVAQVSYCGKQTLRRSHEFDRGNRSRVQFSNFVTSASDPTLVRCDFFMSDEMDRVAGVGGWHMFAEFTCATTPNGPKIQRFVGLPPHQSEVERHQRAKRPFQEWAWKHAPNDWAKAFAFMPEHGFAGFDYALGAMRTRLAHAWRDSVVASRVFASVASAASTTTAQSQQHPVPVLIGPLPPNQP